MTQPNSKVAPCRLSLGSRLSDLAQVSPWVAELAAEHAIPPETRFAIELCLEEALSNSIRHGYRNEPGHRLAVEFSSSEDDLIFMVEDSAPPFEPKRPAAAAPADLNAVEPGGQGIRLMYQFARSVEYERSAGANRLRLRFAISRG
jgi:serine/threonine-protein kinase RsbW